MIGRSQVIVTAILIASLAEAAVVPRLQRSLEEAGYLPPEQQYVPQNYIRTEEKDYLPPSDVSLSLPVENIRNGEGISPAEVRANIQEPDGYFYPKPTRTFDISPVARINVEPQVSASTVEPQTVETTTLQDSTDLPARAERSSEKLQTDPKNGPVTIQTQPFAITQAQGRQPTPFLSSRARRSPDDEEKPKKQTKPWPRPERKEEEPETQSGTEESRKRRETEAPKKDDSGKPLTAQTLPAKLPTPAIAPPKNRRSPGGETQPPKKDDSGKPLTAQTLPAKLPTPAIAPPKNRRSPGGETQPPKKDDSGKPLTAQTLPAKLPTPAIAPPKTRRSPDEGKPDKQTKPWPRPEQKEEETESSSKNRRETTPPKKEDSGIPLTAQTLPAKLPTPAIAPKNKRSVTLPAKGVEPPKRTGPTTYPKPIPDRIQPTPVTTKTKRDAEKGTKPAPNSQISAKPLPADGVIKPVTLPAKVPNKRDVEPPKRTGPTTYPKPIPDRIQPIPLPSRVRRDAEDEEEEAETTTTSPQPTTPESHIMKVAKKPKTKRDVQKPTDGQISAKPLPAEGVVKPVTLPATIPNKSKRDAEEEAETESSTESEETTPESHIMKVPKKKNKREIEFEE